MIAAVVRTTAWRGVTEALSAMGEEVVICCLCLWREFHNLFGVRVSQFIWGEVRIEIGIETRKKLKLHRY